MAKAAPWISLARGILAVALGLALLIQPDKARPMLGNFMGMYWLVSGLMSLRWGVRGERARGLSVAAGVVGILAGVAMLGRFLSARWIAEDVIFYILGAVMALTGLMHVGGGFRAGKAEPGWHAGGLRQRLRAWPWTAALLGVFEIVLGIMLIVSPYGRGPWFYAAGMIWALVGGAILIGDAIRMRRAGAAAHAPPNS